MRQAQLSPFCVPDDSECQELITTDADMKDKGTADTGAEDTNTTNTADKPLIQERQTDDQGKNASLPCSASYI